MFTAEQINQYSAGFFPGLLGLHVNTITEREVRAELSVRQELMAPNGFLHAGAVVTLADTACGYGCGANLPQGANGFTTIELKSNHLGTTREGIVECLATLLHAGKTTQVWDAVVTHSQTGKTLALFRCTQMILYPKV